MESVSLAGTLFAMQFFGFNSATNCTSIQLRNRLQYTYREAINLLSNRQMRILHLLIEEQDYITIAELAERFNVSQRTIQYDLKESKIKKIL